MPGKHRAPEPEIPNAVQIIMALSAAIVGVTAALAQIVVITTAQLIQLSRDPSYLAGPLRIIDHEPLPQLSAPRHGHDPHRGTPR
jgi:hypothetical protein